MRSRQLGETPQIQARPNGRAPTSTRTRASLTRRRNRRVLSVGAIHSDETAGNVDVFSPRGAIRGGGFAGQLSEQATERSEAMKTDLIADLGDRQWRRHQQFFRAVDSFTSQILMRRLTVGRAEGADEVKGRQTRALGEPRDRQRLCVMLINERTRGR